MSLKGGGDLEIGSYTRRPPRVHEEDHLQAEKRGLEETLLSQLLEGPMLWTPWFQTATPELRDNTFLLLKSLGLWYFFMAPQENEKRAPSKTALYSFSWFFNRLQKFKDCVAIVTLTVPRACCLPCGRDYFHVHSAQLSEMFVLRLAGVLAFL